MIIAFGKNYFIFFKVKGCLDIVGGNIQMSSTEFTTHPGLQTNHQLNEKSKYHISYIIGRSFHFH